MVMQPVESEGGIIGLAGGREQGERMIGCKVLHLRFILTIVVGLLCGCFLPQVYDTTQHRQISLTKENLNTHGLAFLTPSTVTGQEQEKQAVALEFSEVLKKERPAVRCFTLPETINALSQAGLADEYKKMVADYRDTGMFNKETLRKVGEAVKTRYVVQLKLMNFAQGSGDRFSVLGLRLIQTTSAHVRIFFQIWDSQEGLISWEGIQEMHYAIDTVKDKSVPQKTIMEKAAHSIISLLP
jgi:hypothetical protein